MYSRLSSRSLFFLPYENRLNAVILYRSHSVKRVQNKKVLLRDRKRNTTHGVASLALRSGAGEYPRPGEAVPPVLSGGTACPEGVPPVLSWGYSSILYWLGYPPGRTCNRTLDRTSDRTRGYPLPLRKDLGPEAGKVPRNRGQGQVRSTFCRQTSINTRILPTCVQHKCHMEGMFRIDSNTLLDNVHVNFTVVFFAPEVRL